MKECIVRQLFLVLILLGKNKILKNIKELTPSFNNNKLEDTVENKIKAFISEKKKIHTSFNTPKYRGFGLKRSKN